jgi:hypothetical protein
VKGTRLAAYYSLPDPGSLGHFCLPADILHLSSLILHPIHSCYNYCSQHCAFCYGVVPIPAPAFTTFRCNFSQPCSHQLRCAFESKASTTKMVDFRRGPWSQAEDLFLLQCVQSDGASNWVRISQAIQTRSPKQCRERYNQNLKPALNEEPFTPEEGEQIDRMVREMGQRWAEIARRLNGRSDNAVKQW